MCFSMGSVIDYCNNVQYITDFDVFTVTNVWSTFNLFRILWIRCACIPLVTSLVTYDIKNWGYCSMVSR